MKNASDEIRYVFKEIWSFYLKDYLDVHSVKVAAPMPTKIAARV